MIITVDGIEMDLLTPWAAVGPGRTKEGAYASPCAYVENSAGGVIGNAHGFGHGLAAEQIEAVARLMAAAPDLLEALEIIEIRVSNGTNLWSNEIQKIRQAIGKAYGRL